MTERHIAAGPAQADVSPVEMRFERFFFNAFRILHLPLFLGLLVAMAAVVYMFFDELKHLVFMLLPGHAPLSVDSLVMAILGLLDLVMIGNLVMLMAVSGYENHVSRLEVVEESESGFKAVGLGTLKIKLVASIVGITTIKLLAVFLAPDAVEPAKMAWMLAIHSALVVTMVLLGIVDRYLTTHGEAH